MTGKCYFFTILVIVLFMSLLLGCRSTPAESTPLPAEMSPTAAEVIPTPTELPPTPTKAVPTPTELPPTPTEVPPTPDPALSIVWSDDFEDGDFADWVEGYTGTIYVNEGVLTIGPDSAGVTAHRSEVVHGTWSFDVLISDQMLAQNHIVFCDEDIVYGLGIEIKTKQNTVISFRKVESGIESNVEAFEAEGQITGWNHFDITRDEVGNSSVYMNGEPILEYTDELSITPYWFYFSEPVGSALDNVVVRDQVIEIQAQE